MNFKYKYSIIIPVYNSQEYIKKCLDSILIQKYDYEIILIDDGSIDNSGKICDEYAKKFNNIIAYHQKNKGVSSTRNFGIKHSSGKFVLFIDSDDYISKKYFSIIEENLNDLNHLLCFNISYDNGKSNNYKQINKFSGNKAKKIYILKKYGLFNSPVNKVYSNLIIQNNNLFFDETIESGEDYIFNVDYFNCIDNINLINDPLYFYYNNQYSITHNKFGMTIEQQIKMFDYNYEKSKDNLDELKYVINDYVSGLYSVIKFNIINKYKKSISIEEIKKIINNSEFIKISQPQHLSFYKRVLYFLSKIRKYKLVYYLIKIRVNISILIKRLLRKI